MTDNVSELPARYRKPRLQLRHLDAGTFFSFPEGDDKNEIFFMLAHEEDRHFLYYAGLRDFRLYAVERVETNLVLEAPVEIYDASVYIRTPTGAK